MSQALASGHATVIPTRSEIREYVASLVAEVRKYAAAGGNPQHWLLDQSDLVEAFAALIAEPARSQFVRIYAEELEAATAGVGREVQMADAKALGKASGQYGAVATIGSIVTFLLLLSIVRSCT